VAEGSRLNSKKAQRKIILILYEITLRCNPRAKGPLVRSNRTVTFDEEVLDLTLLHALLFFSVAQKEVQNGKYL
jgi:hypothetical protein